ncbi:MAG TPA: RNA polymerase sigma factor [Mycobacteriales bacterium]|nr:RNA polymerase sigma factor [Mycobacteriales bacterium]
MAAAPEVVSAVWRSEAARLVAGLTRMTQDLGLAEDLAQDALVAALEQWPERGVPDNPGAWLMAVSKRRAIDHFRRAARLRALEPSLAPEPEMPDLDAAVDHIEDDVLRLMFTACHPVLTTESRVALTLRLVGGLSTREIARAYLSSEATVAQRISRAKRTIAEAGVPFEVPSGPERPERLASVLEVVYLIFNEGYAATSGDDWVRPALSDEALRLGRLLASLAPREPEVHGLLALMQLQASRSAARIGPSGEAVLLRDQDRGRWDRELIAAGLESLRRAGRGPYGLQAAIAACHAVAASVEETDWVRIASLYTELAVVTGSPVVELNRAVAVAQAYGPAAGLEIVDGLREHRALRDYHLLPSVRGELLSSLGRADEARAEYARAAELATNEQERALLRRRATT